MFIAYFILQHPLANLLARGYLQVFVRLYITCYIPKDENSLRTYLENTKFVRT